MGVLKWNQAQWATLTKWSQASLDVDVSDKWNGSSIVSGFYIPADAIVPLRAAVSVPSGYTLWSDADDKYIIGAGSTYSVDANGAGTGSVEVTHTTGAHALISASWFGRTSSYAGQTQAQAAHTHSTATASDMEPVNVAWRLIQADADQYDIPQDVILFKGSSGAPTVDFTQYQPTADSIMKAAAAAAEGDGTTVSVATSTDDAHSHGAISAITGSGSNGGAYKEPASQQGGHTHTTDIALTMDLKRVALAAWYSAAGSLALNNTDGSGLICMYQGAVAPSKWHLCDGTDGTPDLRDYFVNVVNDDTDADGGQDGDNGITSTTAFTAGGSHRHTNGATCNDCPREQAYHAAYSGTHSHTANLDDTWIPPYYALSFIIYTG